MPHLQQIVPTVMCVQNSNENHALETKCSYIHTIVKFARSALKGTYSDMCSKQHCQHCTGTQIQIYSSKKHHCQGCQTCTVGYLQWYVFEKALPTLHRNSNPSIFNEKAPLPRLPDLHRRVPTVICVQNSIANTAPEPKSKYIRRKSTIAKVARPAPKGTYSEHSIQILWKYCTNIVQIFIEKYCWIVV